MEPASHQEPHRDFSINKGGPFAWLIVRLHLVRPDGVIRGWWIVLAAWLPIGLGTILRVLFGAQPDPLFFDISVHARLLEGLSLLLFASHLLEPQCRGAVRQLYAGTIADAAAIDSTLDGAERLRDTAWVEVVLAIGSLAIGQMALWGISGPAGLVHGTPHTIWSVARVWYCLFSLPLVQFLALRWLWRWAVWNYVVVRLSHLPLAATATHPDYAAGLSCLAWPLGGFTWFVASVSGTFAGAWGTQLLDHRITVPALIPTLLWFLVGAVVVGCGPLALLSPHVYRARRRGSVRIRPAHPRIRPTVPLQVDRGPAPGRMPLLGTSDIQSLNDLGSAYQVIPRPDSTCSAWRG